MIHLLLRALFLDRPITRDQPWVGIAKLIWCNTCTPTSAETRLRVMRVLGYLQNSPNNGRIRYGGMWEAEMVLVCNADGLHDALYDKSYILHKSSMAKRIFGPLLRGGFLVAEGDVHKASSLIIVTKSDRSDQTLIAGHVGTKDGIRTSIRAAVY